jgi:hypothetical protein
MLSPSSAVDSVLIAPHFDADETEKFVKIAPAFSDRPPVYFSHILSSF